MYNDTIAAISTAPGEGGIGIVRLSGPRSLEILGRIFHPHHPSSKGLRSHRFYYGYIFNPSSDSQPPQISPPSRQDEERIDEVMVVYMAPPATYTREALVEIQGHGGGLVLQRILSLVLAAGARLAEPGEFTLRAFLNGRIDLAQAEAVSDIIRARTATGLKVALNQLGGGLSGRVKMIRQQLLQPLVNLEAAIDFPEEDIPSIDVVPDLALALADLDALLSTAQTGLIYRQGLRTVIVGRPNAGKSSLFNALLRADRTIVTPVPGTTRDTIEETVNIGDIPVVLVDTAGLTVTDDPVERLGVARSHQALATADLLLLVIDQSALPVEADRDLFATLAAFVTPSAESDRVPTPLLIVANKEDLPSSGEMLATVRTFFPAVRSISLSVLEGKGLAALEEEIVHAALHGASAHDGVLVASVRHQDALRRARNSLAEALQAARSDIPATFVAVDLHNARAALGEITGETVGEELLHEIFARFCIGK